MKLLRNKDKIESFLSDKKPHRIEWIIVILVGIILSSFYLYTDIAYTSSRGVEFWNCVAEGIVPMFYRARYEGAVGAILESSSGGAYDFLLYFVFALYDFPLWVWEKITGFSFMQFFFTRSYIKGIVWVFAGFSSYFLYKIAQLCGLDKEEAKWCPFLFMSSTIFFYTEVVTSGYEIISVAFTLLGIYGYLKKNNKCFVLSFAVAIAMKMFAAWIFIPLVLLKEKRIWKILVYGLEGISGIAIPKIYFAVASHYFMLRQSIEGAATYINISDSDRSAGYATNEILAHAEEIINGALFPEGNVTEYTFISMEALPLVFVGMFTIWIFCYLYKKEMNSRQIIYLCALVMSVFVLTVKMHPYWAIIIVPYLVLLIMFHPEKMKDNLILEGVFALGYTINKAITYYWTCNLNMIEAMMMPQHRFVYESSDVTGANYGFLSCVRRLSELISISSTNISYIFKAASVVGLIMFMIWNYPGRKQEAASGTVSYLECRKYLFVRFLISCMVGMLPIIGLLIYIF